MAYRTILPFGNFAGVLSIDVMESKWLIEHTMWSIAPLFVTQGILLWDIESLDGCRNYKTDWSTSEDKTQETEGPDRFNKESLSELPIWFTIDYCPDFDWTFKRDNRWWIWSCVVVNCELPVFLSWDDEFSPLSYTTTWFVEFGMFLSFRKSKTRWISM